MTLIWQNETCPADEWYCKHRAGPKQPPGGRPCLCEISRKSSYLAYYGPSLSVSGTVCALHSNVLIYSLLKLNAAVNAASDSITLCPRSIADEACAPLIKLRHAMEMAKKKNVRHGEGLGRQPPWRAQIPCLISGHRRVNFERELSNISNSSVI